MQFDDGTYLNVDTIREITLAILVLLSMSVLLAVIASS
jgi:hypothetical protein